MNRQCVPHVRTVAYKHGHRMVLLLLLLLRPSAVDDGPSWPLAVERPAAVWRLAAGRLRGGSRPSAVVAARASAQDARVCAESEAFGC